MAGYFRISQAQIARFHEDGYLVVEQLFDAQEMRLLAETARADSAMVAGAFRIEDEQGNEGKIAVWDQPGDDIYGLIGRSERIVDTVEKLLDDEVYFYHSKMILKEPGGGGAWEWHQDYGYWYNYGCLFPDMVSVAVAVDPATKRNGCMQMLRRSHKLGRIEHGRSETQTLADPQRTAEAIKKLELVCCQLQPGDAVFFHCNTLHRSDQNDSDEPRWSLICCYNARHNDPYDSSHHAPYAPLHKVSDDAVRGGR